MKYIASPLLFLALITPALRADPTIDDIRRMARAVDQSSTVIVPVSAEVIAAEPVSSLTQGDAIALAETVATRVPDAFVAVVAKEYAGYISPAVPANAVLVIEGLKPGKAVIGDLILFEKNGELHIRRLLQRIPFRDDASRLVVGYEHAKDRDGIAEEQVKGRVLATFLFDPNAKSSAIDAKVITPAH